MYNYEAVLRAISLSLDRGDKEREMISRFFAEAHGREISAFAFEKGFEKVFERISDLQLDCPDVKEVRLFSNKIDRSSNIQFNSIYRMMMMV